MDYLTQGRTLDELSSATREALLEELKRTRTLCRHLDEIIEYAPDGIYITDGDANAIRINPAFERISGLKREDLLGRNHRDLERDGIISRSCALLAIQRRSTVTIIHEYLPTNRTALDTCTPVFDEHGNITMTVSSIRDLTELNNLRTSLAEEQKLRQQYERQLEELQNQLNLSSELIARDKRMLDTLSLANRMTRVDSTVLLTGETGVGKEEIAQYIHKNSPRREGPFVAVNCGAIPDTLVESELFGYEKGAFTGAQQGGKAGLMEAANSGTLFLDEVGELPLPVQVKLLRVLQSRSVTRVSGTRPIPLDIRVISATNRDLLQMVRQKQFREDLYYRLSVVPIRVPPLRERVEDIIPLSRHFLDQINRQYGLQKRMTQMAYRTLAQYQWPGNVRELKNMIERVAVTCQGDVITAEGLPIYRETIWEPHPAGGPINLREQVERYEYHFIQEAYELYPSVRKAAAYLGMSEPTFVRKRKAYAQKYRLPAGREEFSGQLDSKLNCDSNLE